MMKPLNWANRTLAPPTPCVGMVLMSLCLVKIKGTKIPPPPYTPAPNSQCRENTGVRGGVVRGITAQEERFQDIK